MKKIKILSCAGILASLLIVGCTNNDNKESGKKDNNPPVEEKSDAPIVFVFSGQSNMEGQTNYGSGNGDTSYLTKAFEDLGITDGEECITGIKSVMTSYYGNGYGELDRTNYNTGGQPNASQQPHASNTEDKIKGKFLPTKVGMGHSDSPVSGLTSTPLVSLIKPLLELPAEPYVKACVEGFSSAVVSLVRSTLVVLVLFVGKAPASVMKREPSPLALTVIPVAVTVVFIENHATVPVTVAAVDMTNIPSAGIRILDFFIIINFSPCKA